MFSDHTMKLFKLMAHDDVDGVRKYLLLCPQLVQPYIDSTGDSWIVAITQYENPQLLQTALEIGFSVNTLRMPEKWHALSSAVSAQRLDLVEILLTHGASCNLDRTILTAISHRLDTAFSIKVLEIMLAYDLELNQVFLMFDELGTEFTALDRIDNGSLIYKFMRAHGALHCSELLQSQKPKPLQHFP